MMVVPPLESYQSRLLASRAALAQLDRAGARIANGRALAVAACLGIIGLRLGQRIPPWGWWGAAAALGAFLALALWHQRLFAREARARALAALNERGIARLSGLWHDFPNQKERYLRPEHLYAADLDLFGKGSLFQLLDESATLLGEAKLAHWLLHPAEVKEVALRQELVRELAPKLDFRQRLVSEARASASSKADPQALIRWAEEGAALDSIRWAKPLPFLLPPLTITLGLLAMEGWVPYAALWVSLALQLAVVWLTRRALTPVFDGLAVGEAGLARLASSLGAVEHEPFSHPRLRELAIGLSEGAERASRRLLALGRWYSFAELRRTQFHPAVNLLFLWDLFFLSRLDGWRQRHGRYVRGWFENMAELEALSCLAGFAHDRPGYPFPVVDSGKACFFARGLGHPLLENPVVNDVELPSPGRTLLITGSNMSGKTTLLRSLGVNAVLALSGAPVCAREIRLARLEVMTSMRVKDSLERGVSYFYAEVLRLKAILEAARAAQGQALVLLDEILMGTNTAERQWASREVVRLLRAQGVLLAVATHDLSLATLEETTRKEVVNVHFVDSVEDGKMTFDYRVRQGVVQSTNALRVLMDAGIPVDPAPTHPR